MSLTPAQRVSVRDRTRLLGFPRSGRRAIVVGGGATAARRAAALTRSSSPVTVFAPALCDDVFDLLAERLVTWENRWPTPADLADAWLVHAATGDAELDARICTWASILQASA
jgi:uroporphyrin-III C-methyltransferase/precorrin-2 dehydrogenase/sirohydrochlorin ferrochelatase